MYLQLILYLNSFPLIMKKLCVRIFKSRVYEAAFHMHCTKIQTIKGN